ncbi:MAG: ABC transporter permease, partial [Candidatus Bathyarchaeia archaeon]
MFRRSKEALIGGIIALGFLLVAAVVTVSDLLGVRVTPYDPIQQNVGPALAPPSILHLMGTDIQGRDLLSRIIVATPNDVSVSLAVVGVAL